MKHYKVYLLLILFSSFFLEGFCWEQEGHRITGNIAQKYVTQRTLDSLQAYLGATSLADAAAWMEDIRADTSYNYLRPFHYINIEKGESYNPASQGNIIRELNKVIAELKNRGNYPKAQIALDLKILCNLVGDLHNPLHVGYQVDRGGNSVFVSFLGRQSNLHRVWSADIIKQYSMAAMDCQFVLDGKSDDELKKLAKTDIIGWLNESRASLPVVYDFKNPEIDAAYCRKNRPLIEKELALAGLRLAALLNGLFAN